MLAGVLVHLYVATPIPTALSAAARVQSSDVYYSDGQLVGAFSMGFNRQMVTAEQIPAVLKDAVTAAEDRHFYTEGAISPTGVARAALEDLFGGGLQGGSTLTEQFVKNYYSAIGASRAFGIKATEIAIAAKITETESKTWVMTQYLNIAYLGAGCYGVGAAARTYFNEPVSALTVAQAAMLAAIINQPSYFLPEANAGAPYRALVARWHYVLTNMVRDGAISRTEAAAQRFPAVTPNPADITWSGYRGYIMQMVAQELESTYGMDATQIYNGGLQITTTFSQSQMSRLSLLMRSARQTVGSGPSLAPAYDQMAAVVEQPGTGGITAVYGGVGFGSPDCARQHCDYNMAQIQADMGPDRASISAVNVAADAAAAADGGTYVSPHVIARLQDGGTTIPVRVTRQRVDSNLTAGTLGEAGVEGGSPYWYSGTGPSGVMSVGLFVGPPSNAGLPRQIWRAFQETQTAGTG